MAQYIAVVSTPGYLPMDDDPPVFDTPTQAWEWLADQYRQSSEEFGDEFDYAYFVGPIYDGRDSNQPGTVYVPTPGYQGDHDLGLAYSVTETEPDTQ